MGNKRNGEKYGNRQEEWRIEEQKTPVERKIRTVEGSGRTQEQYKNLRNDNCWKKSKRKL